MKMKTLFLAVAVLCLAAPLTAEAQFGPGPSGPPGLAKKVAPIDLTGYWVSLITEDWRVRMVTPRKGDYPGIFLTPEAQKMALATCAAVPGSIGRRWSTGSPNSTG